jgi:hypothetical protein
MTKPIYQITIIEDKSIIVMVGKDFYLTFMQGGRDKKIERLYKT